jgi:hypothetical protein
MELQEKIKAAIAGKCHNDTAAEQAVEAIADIFQQEVRGVAAYFLVWFIENEDVLDKTKSSNHLFDQFAKDLEEGKL